MPSASPVRTGDVPALDEASRVRQLQALLGQTKQALGTKESELRSVSAQRDLLRSYLSERDAKIQELLARPTHENALRSRIAELEKASLELSTRLAESEARLSEAEGHLTGAQRSWETERSRADERDVRVRQLEITLAQKDEALARAERELAESLTWGVGSQAEDDLKQIRGIGPVFERALKDLGVKSFTQIAGWTSQDIDAIASKIKARPERIRREEWVHRAAELAAGSNRT